MRPLARGTGQRQRDYPQNRAKPGMTAAQRILLHAKVQPDGCWLWGLSLDKQTGYGTITIDKQPDKAHRVSYEAFVGPIPHGLHIDHLCRVRACVNPEHLEPVTPMVNNHRSPITHQAKTHCPRGHEYNDDNTFRTPGRRYCRPCQRAYAKVYNALTLEERAERKAAGLPLVDLDALFADDGKERAA